MPNIKPVSDVRNYGKVLLDVVIASLSFSRRMVTADMPSSTLRNTASIKIAGDEEVLAELEIGRLSARQRAVFRECFFNLSRKFDSKYFTFRFGKAYFRLNA